MQNTSKIPNFQHTLKIPKYIENLHFFPKFPNFGAKFSHVFWGFQSFCTDFSERAWKMLKNAAFPVKIGVDTADILAFWAWNEFWNFDCILVFWPSANSKRKCKHFALTLSTQLKVYDRSISEVALTKRFVDDSINMRHGNKSKKGEIERLEQQQNKHLRCLSRTLQKEERKQHSGLFMIQDKERTRLTEVEQDEGEVGWKRRKS